MPDPKSNDKPDWKQHGIRIVRSGNWIEYSANAGMTRAEAFPCSSRSAKLWAGNRRRAPRCQNGPASPRRTGNGALYHSRRARFRWGRPFGICGLRLARRFYYVRVRAAPGAQREADQPVEAVVREKRQEPLSSTWIFPVPSQGRYPRTRSLSLCPGNREQALRNCRKGISSFLGRAACARIPGNSYDGLSCAAYSVQT